MLADLSIPWKSTLHLAFHLLGGLLIFVATPPAGSSDSVKATVQDTVYVHALQERLTLAGKLPAVCLVPADHHFSFCFSIFFS